MPDEDGRYPKQRFRPMRTAAVPLALGRRKGGPPRGVGSRTKWCERCGHKVQHCICLTSERSTDARGD